MAEDPYALAGRIRAALAAISDHYDAALIPAQRRALHPTPPPQSADKPRKMKTAARPYKHSPAPTSVPALDARIAAHKDLARYTQVVLAECRSIEDGTIVTKVDGASPHGLCKFLDVWALMLCEKNPREGAAAARDLTAHGWTLRRFAFPERPTLALGMCPLEVGGAACGGTVRLSDDTGDAKCGQCGVTAVPHWWEQRMISDDEVKPLMIADELIGYAARSESVVLTHAQLWKAASRGTIPRAGRDAKGRVLYDTNIVIGLIRSGALRVA